MNYVQLEGLLTRAAQLALADFSAVLRWCLTWAFSVVVRWLTARPLGPWRTTSRFLPLFWPNPHASNSAEKPLTQPAAKGTIRAAFSQDHPGTLTGRLGRASGRASRTFSAGPSLGALVEAWGGPQRRGRRLNVPGLCARFLKKKSFFLSFLSESF